MKSYSFTQIPCDQDTRCTTLEYYLPEPSEVKLVLYDPGGHVVSSLVNEVQGTGLRRILFPKSSIPTGRYYFRFDATSLGLEFHVFSRISELIIPG